MVGTFGRLPCVISSRVVDGVDVVFAVEAMASAPGPEEGATGAALAAFASSTSPSSTSLVFCLRSGFPSGLQAVREGLRQDYDIILTKSSTRG